MRDKTRMQLGWLVALILYGAARYWCLTPPRWERGPNGFQVRSHNPLGVFPDAVLHLNCETGIVVVAGCGEPYEADVSRDDALGGMGAECADTAVEFGAAPDWVVEECMGRH